VRRVLAVTLLVVALSACSSSSPMKISNDTGSAVTVVSCVQDGSMNRHIPIGGSFTFDDNVGTRATPDDPGFACLLATSDGKRLCLTLPTDQSARSTFTVSKAVVTPSESACFSRSNPHI
jgi:hypothetical protein